MARRVAGASPALGARVDRYAAEAERLLRRWERVGWRSHDPYDALASRWIRDPARLPRPVRLALVHLHRRSPVDLRGPFRVPATLNAYALGHFASAAARRGASGGAMPARLHGLLGRLREMRVRGGWAYPFDVQTRTLYYPHTTPNVVCTAFAAQAFLDAYDATGEAGLRSVGESAARFVVSELLTGGADRRWFGYLPGDRLLIHNANLLAARLCIRVGTLLGDDAFVEPAARAIATTLSYQRSDGSFLYGVGNGLGWIDGHHTGFVVECLADVLPMLPEVASPMARAAEYYRRALFRGDGLPRPAPGRDLPVDAIAGAQGILTFAKIGNTDAASRVADWMLRNMRNPDGTFTYQRGRFHRKRVPYARWCDAPMVLALATLSDRLEG